MYSRNLALVFLALLLLLLPIKAHAADKISKEKLNSQKRKRTYYLYVPDSVKAGVPAPLLVLLHGSGRNGLTLVEKWKETASREGLIIVGPDSSDSQMWRTPEDGPDFLHDLVESLKTKYAINPRRVYLFGHSGGAVFALNMAMMESEYFAATAVHAGSWREKEEFAVIENAKRKSPLAIFVGDRDEFFPLSSVRATETALKERGFPVELTIIKGHDHWYYDRAPEINRDAWDFLKQHGLSEEPKYEEYGNVDAAAVNASIREINALRAKSDEAMRRVYAQEEDINRLILARDRSGAAVIARAQVTLLDESANALRAASLKTEALSKLKSRGNYAEYFSLMAQLDRKRIEAAEALRERAELLLGDEPVNTLTSKRNEAVNRAEKLNREAEELEQKAARVRPVQRH